MEEATTAPKDETFVIFRNQAKIYLGKRHQKKWLDMDDGIISEGVNYWTDEIPTLPVFINGQVMNDETYGWEILKAPAEDEYVLAADESGQLHIAKFACSWTDRKEMYLKISYVPFHSPLSKALPFSPLFSEKLSEVMFWQILYFSCYWN